MEGQAMSAPLFEVQIRDNEQGEWRTVATPKAQQEALRQCSDAVNQIKRHWGVRSTREAENLVRLLVCGHTSPHFS